MDIILDTCVVCGVTTDAYSDDPHPRCVSCFDKGLSAKWKSSMDPERIMTAKKMHKDGKSVIHISQVLRASPTMVRVWLGLQTDRNGLATGQKNRAEIQQQIPSNIVSFSGGE